MFNYAPLCKLSDIYGRQLILGICVAVFLLGSILCGLAVNIWFLVGFRALQGIGGGGTSTMPMIVIGDLIPQRERAKYTSSISIIFALAIIIAPLIGGLLVDNLSWRWIFYVNIPFGGIALIGIIIGMKQYPVVSIDTTSIDIPGSLLVIGFTSTLILVITWSGIEYQLTSPVILSLLIASILLLILFIYHEFWHTNPILPIRTLFRIHRFVLCSIIMLLAGMTFFGLSSYIPLYFLYARQETSILAGIQLLPMLVAMILASLGQGIYISKTGNMTRVLRIGTIFLCVGTSLLFLLDDETSKLEIAGIFIPIGIGIGVILPVVTAIVQNIVDPIDMAPAVSAISFMRNIGGSIGICVMGAVFNRQLYESYYIHALTGCWYVAVSTSGVMFILSLIFK